MDSSDVLGSVGVPLRDLPFLDRPHQDRILRRWELFAEPGDPRADPDAPGQMDARLYLDVHALEHLLEQAKSSITQRVAIHGLVLEVELREDSRGHRYRVAKFRGVPAPEWSSAGSTLIGRTGG